MHSKPPQQSTQQPSHFSIDLCVHCSNSSPCENAICVHNLALKNSIMLPATARQSEASDTAHTRSPSYLPPLIILPLSSEDRSATKMQAKSGHLPDDLTLYVNQLQTQTCETCTSIDAPRPQ